MTIEKMMSKIELHPFVIDRTRLQQPGAAIQLLGQFQSLSEIKARLAPRLESPKYEDIWSDRDLQDLRDVIAPFIGSSEAVAQQTLAQATFAELAEAFGRALPLVSQAYEAIQDEVSRRDRNR